MGRIITIWTICLAALLLQPHAAAQESHGWSDSGAVPRMPANGVLDEAGLFQRDPERLKAVTDCLQKLQKSSGFRVCFAIYGVLLDDSPTTRAGALQRAWIGENDGLVVVYEADTKRSGYGIDMQSAGGRADDHDPAPNAIPLYILTPLLGRVQGHLAGCPEQGAAYIERYARELTGELDEYFQRGQSVQPEGRVMRLVMLLVGVSCGALLLGLAGKRLLDRSEASRAAVFRFPEVTVGMRLGAPYGGGKISTGAFGGRTGPE